jgi:hypothetical protein
MTGDDGVVLSKLRTRNGPVITTTERVNGSADIVRVEFAWRSIQMGNRILGEVNRRTRKNADMLATAVDLLDVLERIGCRLDRRLMCSPKQLRVLRGYLVRYEAPGLIAGVIYKGGAFAREPTCVGCYLIGWEYFRDWIIRYHNEPVCAHAAPTPPSTAA